MYSTAWALVGHAAHLDHPLKNGGILQGSLHQFSEIVCWGSNLLKPLLHPVLWPFILRRQYVEGSHRQVDGGSRLVTGLS
jgi:hypothetical protein